MTARELRKILHAVENQDLIIKELRAIVFQIEEQDEKLEACELSKLTK